MGICVAYLKASSFSCGGALGGRAQRIRGRLNALHLYLQSPLVAAGAVVPNFPVTGRWAGLALR